MTRKAIKRLDPSQWPSPSIGANPYRHLYVIQEGADGPVKVGIAANAACRRVELQAGNPRALFLRAIFASNDKREIAKIERELHAKMLPLKIVNEWFSIDPDAAIALIEMDYC